MPPVSVQRGETIGQGGFRNGGVFSPDRGLWLDAQAMQGSDVEKDDEYA